MVVGVFAVACLLCVVVVVAVAWLELELELGAWDTRRHAPLVGRDPCWRSFGARYSTVAIAITITTTLLHVAWSVEHWPSWPGVGEPKTCSRGTCRLDALTQLTSPSTLLNTTGRYTQAAAKL
jgi:hypothetical protein